MPLTVAALSAWSFLPAAVLSGWLLQATAELPSADRRGLAVLLGWAAIRQLAYGLDRLASRPSSADLDEERRFRGYVAQTLAGTAAAGLACAYYARAGGGTLPAVIVAIMAGNALLGRYVTPSLRPSYAKWHLRGLAGFCLLGAASMLAHDGALTPSGQMIGHVLFAIPAGTLGYGGPAMLATLLAGVPSLSTAVFGRVARLLRRDVLPKDEGRNGPPTPGPAGLHRACEAGLLANVIGIAVIAEIWLPRLFGV
jgi:hypothetical protein